MSEMSSRTSTAFDNELTRLESIPTTIRARDDLYDLLLKLTALQRLVFEEIKRRKTLQTQKPAA